MTKHNDTRSLVESLIDSMVQGEKPVIPAVAKDTDIITVEEGEDVVCPDCGSKNMIEGFVESDDSNTANLAYACAECDLKLVSDEEYNFAESHNEDYEAEIDPEDPKCPNCQSDKLNHQVVESDGKEQLILDCGGCGAAMSVITGN